jgi:hypothetical protein
MKEENNNQEVITLLKSKKTKSSFIHFYEKAVIAICFFVSFTVMLGWFLNIKFLLTILPESATMKFNTAIIFFITGINLAILKANSKSFKKVYNFLAVATIVIGVISILEYFEITILEFDNFFVKDNYSIDDAGRMSPATAVSSILLGFGFLGNDSKINFIKKISEDTVLFVALISLISLFSYLFFIPLENRSYFFETTAFHTSGVFFIISILLIFNNNSLYIKNLAIGKSNSNKIFRKLLPKIIYFPIALGSILLVAINLNLVNSVFAISSFVFILIFINIIYVTHISKNFDKKK